MSYKRASVGQLFLTTKTVKAGIIDIWHDTFAFFWHHQAPIESTNTRKMAVISMLAYKVFFL